MGTLGRIIVFLITVIVIDLFFSKLIKAIIKEDYKESINSIDKEHVVVRAPKAFLWVGVADIAFFGAFIGMMFFYPPWSNKVYGAWVWIIVALFVLMGVVLILEVLFGRVDVYKHENYFCIRSVLSFGSRPFKTYKVYYSDCIGYKFCKSGYLVLKTEKNTFYIDPYYSNIDVLVNMIHWYKVKVLRKEN